MCAGGRRAETELRAGTVRLGAHRGLRDSCPVTQPVCGAGRQEELLSRGAQVPLQCKVVCLGAACGCSGNRCGYRGCCYHVRKMCAHQLVSGCLDGVCRKELVREGTRPALGVAERESLEEHTDSWPFRAPGPCRAPLRSDTGLKGLAALNIPKGKQNSDVSASLLRVNSHLP